MGFLFGHGGAFKQAEQNWDKWANTAGSYYQNVANQGIQNSAYQHALAEERKLLENNLAATGATAAVMGSTPAAQALAKQQAAQTIADSTARMGANISQDNLNAMGNYINVAKAATEGKNNALLQEAQAQSQAISGLIQSGASLASSLIPVKK